MLTPILLLINITYSFFPWVRKKRVFEGIFCELKVIDLSILAFGIAVLLIIKACVDYMSTFFEKKKKKV